MRIETITRELYKFEELSKKAKQKAIDDFRQHNIFEDEATIDDAKEIAKLMGITIDKIFYSGFSSQGNGACFEGTYSYTENSVKKLKEYAPVDIKLHGIAQELVQLQYENTNKLNAKIVQRGHYYHSGCTLIEVENVNGLDVDRMTTYKLTDILRKFMNWIYKQLEREYNYQNSDDHIKEMLMANDYEFLKDGTLA